MKETIHYCDVAQHKIKELAVVIGIHVHIGTSMEGSGSSENMYQVVDLCASCAKGILQSLFNTHRQQDISNLQILKRWSIKEHAHI